MKIPQQQPKIGKKSTHYTCGMHSTEFSFLSLSASLSLLAINSKMRSENLSPSRKSKSYLIDEQSLTLLKSRNNHFISRFSASSSLVLVAAEKMLAVQSTLMSMENDSSNIKLMIRLQLEWVLLWCSAWVWVRVWADMWNSETTVRSDYVFDCFHWLIVLYIYVWCARANIYKYVLISVKGVFFLHNFLLKENSGSAVSIYYRTISTTLLSKICIIINLNSTSTIVNSIVAAKIALHYA